MARLSPDLHSSVDLLGRRALFFMQQWCRKVKIHLRNHLRRARPHANIGEDWEWAAEILPLSRSLSCPCIAFSDQWTPILYSRITYVWYHRYVECGGDACLMNARLLGSDVGADVALHQFDCLPDAVGLASVRFGDDELDPMIGQHLQASNHHVTTTREERQRMAWRSFSFGSDLFSASSGTLRSVYARSLNTEFCSLQWVNWNRFGTNTGI